MVVDTLLTVPGLLVLIIIANSIKGVIDITLMALVVALPCLDAPHPHHPRAGPVLPRARHTSRWRDCPA